MTKKLQRTFVREEAYIILRDWIVEGKLEPGSKLRDKELASQLGVSRTPIREALLQLEQEGFVQTKANSATLVAPIDLTLASHLYAIVQSLENLALCQAFEKITSKDIALMTSLNEKLKKAIDAKNPFLCVKCDEEFHALFIQRSSNEELCRILSALKQKLKRLELHYFGDLARTLGSYQEHLEIIEAFKKKNLKLAQKALQNNWKGSFSRFQP